LTNYDFVKSRLLFPLAVSAGRTSAKSAFWRG
jgi:hypothetical protein